MKIHVLVPSMRRFGKMGRPYGSNDWIAERGLTPDLRRPTDLELAEPTTDLSSLARNRRDGRRADHHDR